MRLPRPVNEMLFMMRHVGELDRGIAENSEPELVVIGGAESLPGLQAVLAAA